MTPKFADIVRAEAQREALGVRVIQRDAFAATEDLRRDYRLMVGCCRLRSLATPSTSTRRPTCPTALGRPKPGTPIGSAASTCSRPSVRHPRSRCAGWSIRRPAPARHSRSRPRQVSWAGWAGRLAGLARFARFARFAGLTAGAGCAAGTACPACAGRTAHATVTTVAAVAAGSTLAAVAAGGIDMGRAADRIDVVDHVTAGHRRGGQRDHRRGQKHAGGRAEARHMMVTSQHVARLAVSRRTKEKSHLPASYERGHHRRVGTGLCPLRRGLSVICTTCRVG
jgi:hypothetical protein